MIGFLSGTLAGRTLRGEIVVEVSGVGYRLTVAPSTAACLGEVGDPVTVHTHLHVRDDALALYGFASREERDCFEALIGAHGVGPALALAILSVHSPAELRQALADGDLGALTIVPGVGRKTAARLLMELKSRFEVPEAEGAPQAAGNGASSAKADVRVALAGLGYQAEEVREALRDLPSAGSPDELLRAALKVLAAAR